VTAREEWTDDELTTFGGATEVEVSSRREDGSVRPYVTIWLVRVGSDLYIRSAYGPENPWYRRALSSGAGRIRAGSLERDVTFEQPDPQVHPDVDAAYHAKYDRAGPAVVNTVVGPAAAAVTLRLQPRRT
jgi:hypothetical protein